MIFWGPPGVGKTTLARLTAHYFHCEFIALSAVLAGVKDIRAAIEQGNGRHLLQPVLDAMAACGSLEWTQLRAEQEADKAISALNVLPESEYKEALIALARMAVQRDR